MFGYHDHAIMTASGASNQKVGTSGGGQILDLIQFRYCAPPCGQAVL